MNNPPVPKKKPGRPRNVKQVHNSTVFGVMAEPFINSANIIEFHYTDTPWVMQIFSIFRCYKCPVLYIRFLRDKIIFYGMSQNNDKRLILCSFDANKIYKYYCKRECEIAITQTNTTIYQIMTSITTNHSYVILSYNNIITDDILNFETCDNISDISISKNINITPPNYLDNPDQPWMNLGEYTDIPFHMGLNIVGDYFRKIINKYKHFNITVRSSLVDSIEDRKIEFITSVESQTNKCEFTMNNLNAQHKKCTLNNFDNTVLLRTNFNANEVIKYLSVFKKLVTLSFRNDESNKGGIKMKNINDRCDSVIEIYLFS